jgi:DNA-3-methyladenine glycosylase
MSTHPKHRLDRAFYRQPPEDLARALLGCILVRIDETGIRLAGRIVEVEAYLGSEDRAAHSFGGRRTVRNRSMYLDAGHAYVYFTYGMHHCMNVVSDEPEVATACLIRALEPTDGFERMRQNRSGKVPVERLRDVDLCSGPAKLCQALAIDRALDGEDMVESDRLFIQAEDGMSTDEADIVRAPRIGVAYAGAWAEQSLRWLLRGNRHVSVRPPSG